MGLAPAYASTGLELFSMQMAAIGKFPETLHDNHMVDVIKMFLPGRKVDLPQLVPPGYEMTHSYLSYVMSPHAQASLLHQVSEICVSVLGPLYSLKLISKGRSITRKRCDPNEHMELVDGNPSSSKKICSKTLLATKSCDEENDNDYDETTSKEDHSTASWLSSDPSDDSDEDTDGSYVPSDTTTHSSYSSTGSANCNIESEQDQEEPAWNTDDENSS